MAATQMLTVLILAILFNFPLASGSKEVCQWETFEAKCQEDEVILMKSAQYGRMQVGRCNPRNYFIGCSADVTAIMHARCSGKRYCSVPIPDGAMFAAQPCPSDLVAYLEADYKCVKVAPSNTQDCEDQVLRGLSGYISKPKTKSHSNRHVCPHRILAQPGQTVNVYMYDFVSHSEIKHAASRCINYGYVSEEENTPTKICGGEFKKNHLIYSSDSNVIDITLTERLSHPHTYLLQYKVMGCPKIQPVKNSLVQVRGKTAIVTCNKSNTAVSLVCAGNKWLGELQNCPDIPTRPASGPVSGATLGDFVNNTGLLLVLSVGLSLGVLFGAGLLVLAIKVRARRNKELHVADATFQATLLSTLQPKPTADKPADKLANLDQLPADQYQPVYVPVSIPFQPNPDYEMPVPVVQAHRLVSFGDYATNLESRLPSAENTYGTSDSQFPVEAGPMTENNYGFMPARDCGHIIYDLAAISGRHKTRTLSNDKIVEMNAED